MAKQIVLSNNQFGLIIDCQSYCTVDKNIYWVRMTQQDYRRQHPFNGGHKVIFNGLHYITIEFKLFNNLKTIQL
jgi:hypothetical protein